MKALEAIEDSIWKIRVKHKLPSELQFVQGTIFMELARKTENNDLKFAFLLGSVECFLEDYMVQAFAAYSLFHLGEHLGSALYYRKAVRIAKESLSHMTFDPLRSVEQNTKHKLEGIVKMAESRILHGLTAKDSDTKLTESKEIRIKIRSDSHTFEAKRLRPYWAGMNAESKRNFMKVSTELRSYVERLYGREGLDALEQVLYSARINRKWNFWMCQTCSQKFFSPKKFKNHLEQVHAAKYKPLKKDMAQRVDEVWAGMISVADWEPLDALAAAEIIKNRLDFVKEFVYVSGWSKDWPLAADEERSKLLKEFQLLLVSFFGA